MDGGINMKKNRSRVLVGLMMLMLITVIVGCSGNKDVVNQSNPLLEAEHVSSGWLAFLDEASGLYGFKDQEGKVVIEPIFKQAWDFYGGRAIVMVSPPENEFYGVLSEGIYGLIDPTGSYVVEPEGLLTRVDTWHYLVAEPSEFWGGYGPDNYSVIKKKLIDGEGTVHSETGFYYVMPVTDYLFLANDGSKSYFIDDSGKPLEPYPAFYFPVIANQQGGKIFIKPLDDRTDRIKWVMSLDGENLDEDMIKNHLNDEITYTTQILSPYIGTSIFYPVFSTDSLDTQSKINESVFSIVKNYQVDTLTMDSEEIVDYNQVNHIDNIFSVDFTLTTIGSVINYDAIGYWYGFGAAHPNNIQETYYIDYTTGDRYLFSELFKKDSGWEDALVELIDAAFMSDNDMFLFIDHNTPKNQRLKEFREAHFSVSLTESGLSVYYPQYEIAPFAAGFPTFMIGYDKLSDYYDTDSAFYRALFQ